MEIWQPESAKLADSGCHRILNQLLRLVLPD
jgi:hypothetical protein